MLVVPEPRKVLPSIAITTRRAPGPGLARHYSQRFQRALDSVSGPFGDRGKRARPRQHGANRQPKTTASRYRTSPLGPAVSPDIG